MRPIKASAEIQSFEDAKQFLNGVKCRKIGCNVSVIETPSGAIGVRLYDTLIIKYYTDGTFSADNGEYNTNTTATRCRQFSPPGYDFCHRKKLLMCNGVHATHDVKFPVKRKALRG